MKNFLKKFKKFLYQDFAIWICLDKDTKNEHEKMFSEFRVIAKGHDFLHEKIISKKLKKFSKRY